MSILKWLITAQALLAASVIVAVSSRPALAQFDTAAEAAAYYDEELDDIEWEAGEGYHQEEWYDPSDWFDMDAGVEYEYDNWFGYNDTTDGDWFYDYYDDSSYYDTYNDGIYSSSSSYYDYDDDGVYDAYASYYDWDGDGVYEDYNYYSFVSLGNTNRDNANEDNQASADTQAAEQQSRQQSQQGRDQKSSKEYQVTGQVQQTKKVQVRNGQSLVAEVKADQGTYNIDLGSADQASGWNVSEGTQLSARGPVTQVGDKQVLLAKSVKIDETEHSIDRSPVKLSGSIKSLKKVGVRGTQHQLAVVDVKDKQKKVLVDLGPAEKLPQNFAEGNELTVHGVPIRINERQVLIAQKVESQGQTIDINREQKRCEQAARTEGSTTSR